MEHSLKDLITQSLQTSFPNISREPQDIVIEIPNDEKFGDFSSNIAMQLTKELKKNPRQISQHIIDHFPENKIIEKIEIAGPGFLNFFLTNTFLQSQLNHFSPTATIPLGQGKKVCMDSSHPNIAKPLHFGHLRSTILGESLKRIFEFCDYDFLHDNFLGDWGTQFGKLVVAIRKWGDRQKIESNPIQELVALYQKFHTEAESHPELEDEGREEFRKIEVDQDPENLKLWKWIVAESMKEVQKFYDLVGAKFDVIRGESFWEPMMADQLKLLRESGVGVEGERGALVVHYPEETKLPTMIFQRSDGATLYQTRDLTRISYYETEHFDILLYVVGNDQEMHFKRVFQTAKMLGYKSQCEFVGYGMVRLPEGKMSTRKGTSVGIYEVFDEAIKRTRQALENRETDFSQEEKESLVRQVAVGAIKFNDLSQNRNTTVIFEWEKMLSFEGFSSPFLQYSYARAKSIFRKYQSASGKAFEPTQIQITEDAERKLSKKILEFTSVVSLALHKRMPHFIAEYLYELASTFNSFYVQCPILSAQEDIQRSRLSLTQKMCETLKQGLYLLTIDTPERM